jgi:hypothetical protein
MLSSASHILAKQLHNKPTNLGSLGFIDRHGFIVTKDYELAQHN